MMEGETQMFHEGALGPYLCGVLLFSLRLDEAAAHHLAHDSKAKT